MSKPAQKAPPRAGAAAQRGDAWSPNGRRARLVGEFVPGLMRPAFEKFGFSAATLLTDWEAIAGREIAGYTAPERLKWPRAVADSESGDPGRGATLVLRVAGARALEVEQMRDRLIERINAAFGYRAVSEIRIIQAPLPKRATKMPAAPVPRADISEPVVSALPDGPMKDAFARIARGMKLRQAKEGAVV